MYLSIDRSIDRSAEILHSICRRYLPSISPTRVPIAPQKAMYLDPNCLHIYIYMYIYIHAAVAVAVPWPWPWPSRGPWAVAEAVAVGRSRGRGRGRAVAVAVVVAVGRGPQPWPWTSRSRGRGRGRGPWAVAGVDGQLLRPAGVDGIRTRLAWPPVTQASRCGWHSPSAGLAARYSGKC